MPLFETSAKQDALVIMKIIFLFKTIKHSQSDHVESIILTLIHKLRECKSMHVLSPHERDVIRVQQEEENKVDAANSSWCGCG
jgi:hypothetical protein